MADLAISEEYQGPGVPRYHEAYLKHLPVIEQVAEEELVPINLDIARVVTNTLGVLPQILAMQAELRELAQLDKTALDNLEGYLLALAHANALHVFAAENSALTEPAALAGQVREVLLADARALARRGLITSEGLERLKGTRGHRNIALDLMSLTAVMRHNWQAIEGRTAIRLEELDRAEALADQLLIGVGHRELGRPETAASALIRHRAFSLFVRTYEEVRRAVHFLRWHSGDADEIAPSLYAGRTRRRGDAGVEPELAQARTEEAADAVAGLPAADLPPADLPPADLPPADLPPVLPAGSAQAR